MGEYIPGDERLRRIGELLLKGVYPWAEATQGGETTRSRLEATTDGGPTSVDMYRPGQKLPVAGSQNRVRGRSRPRSETQEERSCVPDSAVLAREPPSPAIRSRGAAAANRLRSPSARGPLDDFASQFDDLFRTVAQRRGFREYLQGLL